MTDESANAGSVRDQLQRAVRDLWAHVYEIGDAHVVFTDRRRERARVQLQANSRFSVSWARDDGTWEVHEREFDNLREAALHGYQGPH